MDLMSERKIGHKVGWEGKRRGDLEGVGEGWIWPNSLYGILKGAVKKKEGKKEKECSLGNWCRQGGKHCYPEVGLGPGKGHRESRSKTRGDILFVGLFGGHNGTQLSWGSVWWG